LRVPSLTPRVSSVGFCSSRQPRKSFPFHGDGIAFRQRYLFLHSNSIITAPLPLLEKLSSMEFPPPERSAPMVPLPPLFPNVGQLRIPFLRLSKVSPEVLNLAALSLPAFCHHYFEGWCSVSPPSGVSPKHGLVPPPPSFTRFASVA